MEGTCEDEVVVCGEFVEGCGKVALVDETAGFVDDYEGVDDPRDLLATIREDGVESIHGLDFRC